MTVKSSISLTDEQHTFAKALVDAGRYPSVSAVLQQGVQLLRDKIEHEAAEHAALVEVLKARHGGKFIAATKMATICSTAIGPLARASTRPSTTLRGASATSHALAPLARRRTLTPWPRRSQNGRPT